MATSFRPLAIRQELRKHYAEVSRPKEYGPDGWHFLLRTKDGQPRSLLISAADHDGIEWAHASIAGSEQVPAYEELTWVHAAVFGDGYSYQCFVPRSSHVNIHEFALHLWGRLDGKPALPDFGAAYGSI